MAEPPENETFEKAAALSAAGDHDAALLLCKEAILKNPGKHEGYFHYYRISSKHLLKQCAYNQALSVKIQETCDIGALLLEKAPPALMPSYKVKVDATNARLREKENDLRAESRKEGLRKAVSSAGCFLLIAAAFLLIAGLAVIFLRQRSGF